MTNEQLAAWLDDPTKDPMGNSGWRRVYEKRVGRKAETPISFAEASLLANQLGVYREIEWEPEMWLVLHGGTVLIYRSERYEQWEKKWLKAPSVARSQMVAE